MEAATVTRDRSRSRKHGDNQFSQDKELIDAKTSGKQVDLVLAADFVGPDGQMFDADNVITAIVLAVDKYSIKFLIRDRKVWISKAFIAGVWV